MPRLVCSSSISFHCGREFVAFCDDTKQLTNGGVQHLSWQKDLPRVGILPEEDGVTSTRIKRRRRNPKKMVTAATKWYKGIRMRITSTLTYQNNVGFNNQSWKKKLHRKIVLTKTNSVSQFQWHAKYDQGHACQQNARHSQNERRQHHFPLHLQTELQCDKGIITKIISLHYPGLLSRDDLPLSHVQFRVTHVQHLHVRVEGQVNLIASVGPGTKREVTALLVKGKIGHIEDTKWPEEKTIGIS